jgi:hypothetical protein
MKVPPKKSKKNPWGNFIPAVQQVAISAVGSS